MAISRGGTTAHVANQAANTISQYNLDASTGTLSPLTPATVATSSYVVWVALSPDGKSAYVTNNLVNTVSQYNVNPRTGTLSSKPVAPVAASPSPYGIVVGPRPMGTGCPTRRCS